MALLLTKTQFRKILLIYTYHIIYYSGMTLLVCPRKCYSVMCYLFVTFHSLICTMGNSKHPSFVRAIGRIALKKKVTFLAKGLVLKTS